MSKSWLIPLLLVSFSFNLAVIGSALYFRCAHTCPPDRPFLDRKMPPAAHLRPFMEKDKEIRQLRENFSLSKEVLLQELAKDPVNEARVKEIIDSSLVAQNALERRIGEKILAYRKTLTPEEAREHFLRRVERMKNRSQFNNKYPNRRKP